MNFYERWILPRLLDLAMRNKEITRFRARLVPQARGAALAVGLGSGLNLPFYGARVERLVAIPDPSKALREARRVLKPTGELLFAEHGLAPDASVRRWQRRLNPLWRRVAGGCNLDRKIDELIAAAGFRFEELDTEYAKGPRPWTYVYIGRAKPMSAFDLPVRPLIENPRP